MDTKRRISQQLSPEEKRTWKRVAQTTPLEREGEREQLKEKVRRQVGDRARRAGFPTDAPSQQARSGAAQPQSQTGPRVRTPRSIAYQAGREVAEAKHMARKGTQALGKGVRKGTRMLGSAGRVVAPVAAVANIVRAVSLATDEEAQQEAMRSFDELGQNEGFLGAVENAVRGGLGGMDTIYGSLDNLVEAKQARARAKESGRAADETAQRLEAAGIMEAGRQRQDAQKGMEAQAEEVFRSLQAAGPDGIKLWKEIRGDRTKLQAAYAAMNPEMEEPEMEEPEMEEPEMEEPEMEEPEMEEPEMEEPEMEEPEMEEPEIPASQRRQQAPPEPEMESDEVSTEDLFATVHGSAFDPKSSMDKLKMQEITDTLAERGGLKGMTPNQFALNIYRKYKYV